MTVNISRRGMFGLIGAAALAPAIIRTPGLLMPIKPRLVQVIPPALLTPAMIAREMARQLWNNGTRAIQSPVLRTELIQSYVSMIDVPSSENIARAARLLSHRAKTTANASLLPLGVMAAAYETYEGVQVRYVADYDIREDKIVHRFDTTHL